MGVKRVDTLGKSGGPARTGVPSGSKGFGQTSKSTSKRLARQAGVPFKSSRHILDAQGNVRLVITVEGRKVTVRDVKSGTVKSFTLDQPVHARDVAIPQENIRRAEPPKRESKPKRRTPPTVVQGTLADVIASGRLGRSRVSIETLRRSGSLVEIEGQTGRKALETLRERVEPLRPTETLLLSEPRPVPTAKREPRIVSEIQPDPFEQRLLAVQQREQNIARILDLPALREDESRAPFSIGEISKAFGRVVVGLAAGPSIVGGRIGIFLEALSRMDPRIKVTRQELGQQLAQQFDPRKPEGIFNIVFVSVGAKTLGDSFLISKAVKTTPDIIGTQGFGVRRGASVQRSEVIRQGEVQGLTRDPTSVTKADIPFPTAASIRNLRPGQATVGGAVFPSGKAYVTVSPRVAGQQLLIQTTRQPSGTTIVKVFKVRGARSRAMDFGEEVLVRQFKTTSKPRVAFTEPTEVQSSRQIVSGLGFRSEAEFSIFRQRSVQLSRDPRVMIRAEVAGAEARLLRVRTDTPAAEAALNVRTGEKFLQFRDTRFQFVDYPVQNKPVVTTISEALVERKTPVVFVSEQSTRIQSQFRVVFERQPRFRRTRRIDQESPRQPLTTQDFLNIPKDQFFAKLEPRPPPLPKPRRSSRLPPELRGQPETVSLVETRTAPLGSIFSRQTLEFDFVTTFSPRTAQFLGLKSETIQSRALGIRQREQQISRQRQRSLLDQRTIQQTDLIQIPESIVETIQTPQSRTLVKLRTSQIQMQRATQRARTRTMQILSGGGFPVTTTPDFFVPITETPGTPPPLFIPTIESQDPRRKRSRKRADFSPGYNPSVEALLFDIRGKRPNRILVGAGVVRPLEE